MVSAARLGGTNSHQGPVASKSPKPLENLSSWRNTNMSVSATLSNVSTDLSSPLSIPFHLAIFPLPHHFSSTLVLLTNQKARPVYTTWESGPADSNEGTPCLHQLGTWPRNSIVSCLLHLPSATKYWQIQNKSSDWGRPRSGQILNRTSPQSSYTRRLISV